MCINTCPKTFDSLSTHFPLEHQLVLSGEKEKKLWICTIIIRVIIIDKSWRNNYFTFILLEKYLFMVVPVFAREENKYKCYFFFCFFFFSSLDLNG